MFIVSKREGRGIADLHWIETSFSKECEIRIWYNADLGGFDFEIPAVPQLRSMLLELKVANIHLSMIRKRVVEEERVAFLPFTENLLGDIAREVM